MFTIIKSKKFISILIGFLLLPIIIPIITDIVDIIFNYGVEIGTQIRHLITGFSC